MNAYNGGAPGADINKNLRNSIKTLNIPRFYVDLSGNAMVFDQITILLTISGNNTE